MTTAPETTTEMLLPSWDLSDYYAGPDDPAIERDLKAALEAAERFAKNYRGKIAAGEPATMSRALRDLEHLNDLIYRPYIFASLLHSADSKPERHGRLKAMVTERATEIEQLVLFFDLEVNEIDDDRAMELLEHPDIRPVAHFLRRKRAMKPHLRTEPEEKVLSQTELAGKQAWNRMFHEIVDYTKFQIEGEERKLPFDQVVTKLYQPDRELRRKAADAITRGFEPHQRPLSFLYNTILLDKKVRDELRHFDGPADSRHLANETDQESVDALLEACERYHPTVERYYLLKARLLGVEKLYDYDRYAPIQDVDRTYDWQEARDIVMEAFEGFSEPFADVARRFFERGWIDVPPREGKRHGAFCSGGVPSVHSYVLMNFTGKPADVKTLAHELGHGVHFELSREKLSLLVLHPTLTLAETASVFAERVVFDRLLSKTESPSDKLALLCTELEQSFATVFRQVGFTRFEMAAHVARRKEGELGFERLCDLWMESGQPMFGRSVELRPEYRNWWLYIPHFIHTPFYCYAYAYGKLLTLALYQMYQEQGGPFIDKYLALLARGGSQPPEELLGPLGVDTRDPDFWSRGLEMLEAMVRQAEKLAAA